MQAAKAHGMVFRSQSMGNIDVVNPLQWFTIYDVFSVLAEYDAPVHPIYKKFAVDNHNNANGEPLFIRLGYVTAKDLMDKGTVLFLKVNYPELYSKLVQANPDVSRFT
jgi:3'-phosphoadenosine 5'-phosphosulfate sulfotransferase (PAPS reductase)/FAD synthetase